MNIYIHIKCNAPFLKMFVLMDEFAIRCGYDNTSDDIVCSAY